MKWHKVKIGDFLKRVKNLVPILDDEEYNLVTIKLYHKGVKLRKTVRGAEMQADKMSKVKAGQFILSGIDARNGAFGIIPPELEGAVVTNDFWHFEIDRKIISNEYFLWLTSTPYFDDICNKASDGTTNRIRLQSDRFYSQELMIPEIQDQHIVVENLKSTNQKIKQLETEYKFQLTQIENLNQAILQEAVQGKLIPQNPTDETATELLKRIKAEKGKLGKKEKPLPPIKPEEIPFDIPKSWVWCRLGEITDVTMGQSPDGSSYNEKGIGTPLINGPVEFGGKGAFDKTVAIKFTTQPTKYCKEGDLLICVRGSTTGRTNIAAFDACIGRGVAAIRGFFYEKFIYNYVLFVRYKIFGLGKGTTFPNLSQEQLNSVLIPLPPLSEQKRIVAEIEQQLAKTKQLKAHIIANQQATEQLLKALLHQAFEVGEKEEEQ